MTIAKVPPPYVPVQRTTPAPPPPPPGGPGRAAPPPSIGGVLAPNQRVLQWDQISQVTKPFADPKTNEFGFWFNYFWAEATTVSDLSHAQKVKIQESFLKVFEFIPGGGYRLRADFPSLSSSAAENVLRQLLLIGFRRVALTLPPPATRLSMASLNGATTGNRFKMKTPLLAAQDASDLNFIQVVAETGARVSIGFRADARASDKLSSGFVVRAREAAESEELKKYGLDQPWHPYSNPVYKNSLFLRIGTKNKDNCLNTVISVGQHLKDITHFPILSDYVLIWDAKSPDGTFLAIKPFDTWKDTDVLAAESHWRGVKVVKVGPAIDHLLKENFMYIFHTTGLKGVNTQKHFGGDAFNERGMQGIPDSHMLAAITFHQKWYYRAEKGQIEIYEVEFKEIRWLKGVEVYDSLLGPGGRDRLETKIREEMSSVAAKYAPEKQRKEHPPVAITAALTPQDLASINAKLVELYKTNSALRGNVAEEKRLVSEQLPALATRIRPMNPAVWANCRPKAVAVKLAPPPPMPVKQ